MVSKSLTISVGNFIAKTQGARECHDFDVPLDFSEAGIHLSSNVSGCVELLKLPHEINVAITGLHASAEAKCSRCLERCSFSVDVPLCEREFLIDLAEEKLASGEEVFYVHRERNEIDCAPFIREEILLHFPPVPICSEGCKGLCDRCGANLNKGSCNCPRKNAGPLSALRNLFQ